MSPMVDVRACVSRGLMIRQLSPLSVSVTALMYSMNCQMAPALAMLTKFCQQMALVI